MDIHPPAPTPRSWILERRTASRLALAPALLLMASIAAGVAPAAAQTTAPADAAKPVITEDMVRRVGAPPRPNAELRIEVQPGTAPRDERKARRPKLKKAEQRP